jgi:site-specific DNA-methyltransferase (adenine-specific)
MELNVIRTLEARKGLSDLANGSVDCVVTSPPYWACRDYGLEAVAWNEGPSATLGLEPDFEHYIAHLLEVLDDVKRVLKPQGTLWLNLGDVYASGSRARWRGTLNRHLPDAGTAASPVVGVAGRLGSTFRKLPDKTLCMIPERVALRMLERGWVLRNKLVWHKPNFLPSCVRDRFACSWEYLFLFTKSERYYFDIDAVRAPHSSPHRLGSGWQSRTGRASRPRAGMRAPPRPGEPGGLHHLGKNPGDCWMIATGNGRADHPAVFPEALCERPILAGCPVGGLVLDPFAGSGTACVVAKRLGRSYLGFEANPLFAEHARRRLASVPSVAVGAGSRPA